jgi:hypothetical protein
MSWADRMQELSRIIAAVQSAIVEAGNAQMHVYQETVQRPRRGTTTSRDIVKEWRDTLERFESSLKEAFDGLYYMQREVAEAFWDPGFRLAPRSPTKMSSLDQAHMQEADERAQVEAERRESKRKGDTQE